MKGIVGYLVRLETGAVADTLRDFYFCFEGDRTSGVPSEAPH